MIRDQLDFDFSGEAAAILAHLAERPDVRARVQAVLAPEQPPLDLSAEPDAAAVLRYLSARPELAVQVMRASPADLRVGREWTQRRPRDPAFDMMRPAAAVIGLPVVEVFLGDYPNVYRWGMPYGGDEDAAIGGWLRAEHPRHAMLLVDAFARTRGFTLIGEPPLRDEPCKVCDGTGTVREDKRLPGSLTPRAASPAPSRRGIKASQRAREQAAEVCWGCRGALRLPVPHEQDEPVGTLKVAT